MSWLPGYLSRANSGSTLPADSLSGIRVLCLPSGIGFAHLGRTLLVADDLRRLGCEVVFAYGGSFTDAIIGEGYHVYPVSEIEMPSSPDFSGPIMERYTEALAVSCVESELAVIRDFAPHTILSDLRPTAAISSAVAQVPHVALLNAYLHPKFDLSALYPDRIPSTMQASRIERARRLVVDVNRLISYQVSRGLRAASRRFGVPAHSRLLEYFSGNLNLLVDLPALAPLNITDRSSVYTGPLIWEPSSGTVNSQDLPILPSGFYRIYVSAGYTGKTSMLDRVATEFQNIPNIQLVISTGPYIDSERWNQLPHIWARQSLPVSQILSGCALAIHTGASGVTYQCMSHGVPSIALPGNSDQHINTRLATRLGALIGLDLDRLPAGALAELVQQMIDRQVILPALPALQRSFNPASGPRNAARMLAERICPERVGPYGTISHDTALRFSARNRRSPSKKEAAWQA